MTRIAFTASNRPEAQEALARLAARYGDTPMAEADVIVALGGDGFMLETFHEHMSSGLPVYGMNRGSVGFLMNEYSELGLVDRIAAAEDAVIHPLRMTATDVHGKTHEALAINEVSLLRQTRQVAKPKISIDGKLKGWFTDDTAKPLDAYGWHVVPDVDGHDADALAAAVRAAPAQR